MQKTAQLPLPAQGFTAPEQMAAWLQQALQFTPGQVTQVKSQPASKVVWADQEVLQPERWTVSLNRPDRGVNAEYFVGNRFVNSTNSMRRRSAR